MQTAVYPLESLHVIHFNCQLKAKMIGIAVCFIVVLLEDVYHPEVNCFPKTKHPVVFFPYQRFPLSVLIRQQI